MSGRNQQRGSINGGTRYLGRQEGWGPEEENGQPHRREGNFFWDMRQKSVCVCGWGEGGMQLSLQVWRFKAVGVPLISGKEETMPSFEKERGVGCHVWEK